MDEDDDLGFVADDAGDADDLGFVADDVPPEGVASIPAGYAETGARELELPETSFVVDRRRPSRSTTTVAPGGPTERRVIDRRVRMRSPSGRVGDVWGADEDRAREAGFAEDTPQRRQALAGLGSAARPGDATVDALLRVLGGMPGAIADSSGIETPSAGSMRRAVDVAQRDGSEVSDVLATLLPTSTPEQPIVGRDMRSQAMWTGLGQALTLGHADELGGMLGGVPRPWLGERGTAEQLHTGAPETYQTRRDAARDTGAAAMAQAPGAGVAGSIAGSAPYAGIPAGAMTALGRISAAALTGAGLGGLRGAGDSEGETAGDVLRDAGEGAAVEGGLSALLAGGGEVLGPLVRRIGRRLTSGADDAAYAGMRSRLEGTGVWGGRAMRAADEMPGGQQALTDDLRRLRVGGGRAQAGGVEQASRMPRPERALDDAADVMDDAWRRMDGVLSTMDDAAQMGGGFRDAAGGGTARGYVDVTGAADALEAIAARYERIPVGGPQVARALRERIIAPWRQQPRMSFRDAHQQRQLLDDYVRTWRADPDLTTASGQLQTARRQISSAMDDAAERLDPAVRAAWRQANRDYSVGAFLGEYGRGAERLSMQGGIGGAAGTAIENSGLGAVAPVVGAPIQREAAQQVRMRWPGMRAVALESLAPRLRSMGAAGERWARMLEAAQRRGQTAAAAAHATMQRTDPAYRRAVMELEEQAAEGGEEYRE